MKKPLLFIATLAFFAGAFAQGWEIIYTTPGNTQVTTLTNTGVDIYMGTAGDGIFKTTDNGDNWVDANGDLPEKNINRVATLTGVELLVSTTNGAFLSRDFSTFTNQSTGLTNLNVSFYGFGGDNDDADWAIGTLGGGIFVSPELEGSWTEANSIIDGDGLYVNRMTGYSQADEFDYFVLATDGGVYFSNDELDTWVLENDGLTGDATVVKDVIAFSDWIFIATHGGLFMKQLGAATWTPLIPDVKFNCFAHNFPHAFDIFVLGEKSYYAPDLQNWVQIDMTGAPGEIIAAAMNSTHLLLGTSGSGKSVDPNVYRKTLEDAKSVITEINRPQTSNVLKNKIQAYPNPFQNTTTFNYSVSENNWVSLKIYDILGKEVATIVNEEKLAGTYTIKFNGKELESNIYFYQLQVGNQYSRTQKIIKVQ